MSASPAPDPVPPPAPRGAGPASGWLPLSERLELPLLDDLEVVGWVEQALRDATARRQGVVVYGAKGTGRSEALAAAAARFQAGEIARRQRHPEYRPRRVRVLPTMRPRNRTELFHALYVEEMGDIPWRLSRGGDDVVLRQLVAVWEDDHVAALCFSEADHFAPAALDGLRDIMARAGDPRPAAGAAELRAAGAAAERGGRVRRAAGVGIVLVGLPAVYDRLRASPEWGHRWRRAYAIDGLTPGALADVYRRVLPACDRHAEHVGREAWAAFVHAHVAPRIGGALRRVHEHVEEYVALCEAECTPPPTTLGAVPWDGERFLDALDDLAGPELPADA